MAVLLIHIERKALIANSINTAINSFPFASDIIFDASSWSSFCLCKAAAKAKPPKKRKLHAFQIRRKKKDGNHLHVHESVVSVQAVLKRSRELGVSMTVFLTALFMMAINEEMSKMQKKKPVVLMVPVNLRKFFPSLSMLNFFNWIEPGYNFTTQDQSFEAIWRVRR